MYNQTYGELVRTNSSISPNVTLRTRRILRYFKSSVATMDLLRTMIIRLRGTMKDLIRGEIGSVDREYAVRPDTAGQGSTGQITMCRWGSQC